MNNQDLRAAVATMDQSIARVSLGDQEPLRVSFTALVDLLQLGPAPELKACPKCKKIGMRAATRCGFCWTSLTGE